jgi:MOSC domain-containing protein YiiM
MGDIARYNGCGLGAYNAAMPHIVSIAYTPTEIERRPDDRYARMPLERAKLAPRHGIEGDAKASRGKRQLNVMLAEDVAQLRAEGFHAVPGELGEQLVIAGLARDAAVPGARVRLGDSAVIELVDLRTPCGRFARVQGRPATEAVGRIGFMARVLVGGEIAVGSPAAIVANIDQTAAG